MLAKWIKNVTLMVDVCGGASLVNSPRTAAGMAPNGHTVHFSPAVQTGSSLREQERERVEKRAKPLYFSAKWKNALPNTKQHYSPYPRRHAL